MTTLLDPIHPQIYLHDTTTPGKGRAPHRGYHVMGLCFFPLILWPWHCLVAMPCTLMNFWCCCVTTPSSMPQPSTVPLLSTIALCPGAPSAPHRPWHISASSPARSTSSW
uniref:Uncharacterized protein n=1 Tax=Arundo donax TaxID=35708 RepID=A0A0A9HQC3_ARUDO